MARVFAGAHMDHQVLRRSGADQAKASVVSGAVEVPAGVVAAEEVGSERLQG